MNLKRVGKAIMFLGLAVLLYGGGQSCSNNEREKPSGNSMSPNYGGRSGEYDRIERENTGRSEKQREATIIMAAGGIAIVAGLYISEKITTKE